MPYFALLDDAVRDCATLYDDYVESRFLQADTLHGLDGLLQQGWQRGLHVVLWADYAFGHPLQHLSPQPDACLALHWFRKCETVAEPEKWLQSRYPDHAPAGISTPTSHTGKADYLHAVGEIQAAIARGDTYQINYTTRLQLQSYGHPAQLYRRLRQPVPYAALAHLPDHKQQPGWTLSFSPELFVNIASDGLITTEPMKGTAPILGDGHDAERAAFLQNDAKNRAENVMIVDLLRNDLGKLAVAGGVSVPQAFEVTAFGSVWQMTSTVVAHMRPETTVADIIAAAFPCGSITGAPKRMAMQVIGELEQRQRGLYTGSVGYLEPCATGLGFQGTWNVVIRSLALTELATPQRYHVSMGIGSGIVIDSRGADEWDECAWKARFVRGLPAEVGLIETLRVENGVCELLPLHQARLQQSAADLHIAIDESRLWQDLQAACETEWAEGVWRVKCSIAADGSHDWQAAPLATLEGAQSVCMAEAILPKRDVLRRYKTQVREQFDAVWQQAAEQGAFDGLLFNADGVLLEGGRSNVFVQIDGVWYTPALDLDVLNGVMRQAVMAEPLRFGFDGGIQESRSITRQDLQAATQIRLSNALRGVFAVALQA